MIFSLEIKYTAMLSYAFPSDIEIITLKFLFKWAAKNCGPLKRATAPKSFRNSGVNEALWRGVYNNNKSFKP